VQRGNPFCGKKPRRQCLLAFVEQHPLHRITECNEVILFVVKNQEGNAFWLFLSTDPTTGSCRRRNPATPTKNNLIMKIVGYLRAKNSTMLNTI